VPCALQGQANRAREPWSRHGCPTAFPSPLLPGAARRDTTSVADCGTRRSGRALSGGRGLTIERQWGPEWARPGVYRSFEKRLRWSEAASVKPKRSSPGPARGAGAFVLRALAAAAAAGITTASLLLMMLALLKDGSTPPTKPVDLLPLIRYAPTNIAAPATNERVSRPRSALPATAFDVSTNSLSGGWAEIPDPSVSLSTELQRSAGSFVPSADLARSDLSPPQTLPGAVSWYAAATDVARSVAVTELPRRPGRSVVLQRSDGEIAIDLDTRPSEDGGAGREAYVNPYGEVEVQISEDCTARSNTSMQDIDYIGVLPAIITCSRRENSIELPLDRRGPRPTPRR
jgi:hypothetical protein